MISTHVFTFNNFLKAKNDVRTAERKMKQVKKWTDTREVYQKEIRLHENTKKRNIKAKQSEESSLTSSDEV